MKELTRWALVALMTASMAACVGGGRSNDGDDGFAAEADSLDGGATASMEDEFADFEDAPAQASNESPTTETGDDFSLDDEAPAQGADAGTTAANNEDLNVDDLSLDTPADLPPEPSPENQAATPPE
ncbi:MAG TPA: hypothetical protein PL182_03510, partial [Pseudobdellovibrionaceae bacterium]|nr:hypothetical protein [Pseudobdellovibrionaceae bacterium]